MTRLLLVLAFLLYSTFSFTQDFIDGHYLWSGVTSEHIGSEEIPQGTDSVLGVRDQGGLMDFSNGFQIGDSIADLTVYNLEGESFNVNSLLEEASISGKYAVLFSGSNSCNKATDFFNANTYAFSQAQTFLSEHLEDFNWIMVYGYEAHPIDTHNCLSNCPPAPVAGPSGIGEFQHTTYQERLDAISRWVGVQNGSIEVPETIATYANGSQVPTGEIAQDYVRSVLAFQSYRTKKSQIQPDFARAVLAETAPQTCVFDVSSDHFVSPARRPKNSRLNCDHIFQDFGIPRPEWIASFETSNQTNPMVA